MMCARNVRLPPQVAGNYDCSDNGKTGNHDCCFCKPNGIRASQVNKCSKDSSAHREGERVPAD